MKKNHFQSGLSALAASAVLAACTSSGRFAAKTASPLPIEVFHAAHGEIASGRAFEAGGKLYVTGSMRKHAGRHIAPHAHVDIQLIAGNGRVIAERHDEIEPAHPRHEQARGGHYAYVASFPAAQARQAAKIRVSYHLERHGEGRS